MAKCLSGLPRLGEQAPRDQQRKQSNRRDNQESSCQAEAPCDQAGERGTERSPHARKGTDKTLSEVKSACAASQVGDDQRL